MTFVDKVIPNGEWDYKTKEAWRWNYIWNDTDGSVMEEWQKNTKKCIWVSACGGLISGADLGNINYGFVAIEVMTEEVARSGAGALQILQGRSSVEWADSYFDDPEDMSFINTGIIFRGGI